MNKEKDTECKLIVIGSYAIKINDIKYLKFRTVRRKPYIKVFLNNKVKLKIKFKSYWEYCDLLEYLTFYLKIKDYNLHRTIFDF